MQPTPKLAPNSHSNTVLFVGPRAEDHKKLSEILAEARPSGQTSLWGLETSPSLEPAIGILKRHRLPVVICDTELGPESWQQLLEELVQLPEPPCLIVTSRAADEHLWAEALNLGAYDVLAKPFDPGEVTRVLSSAWRHRNQVQPNPAKMASARIFSRTALEPAV
jgi:DNA-binding NtrC family response regulator